MTGRRPAVVATAPGKLILMGEHAAVYGRPAVVAALGLRATARFESPATAAEVELDLPDLGHRQSLTWKELVDHAARVRRAWEAYAEEPTAERFASLGSADPGHLVKTALGETGASLGVEGVAATRLRVASEIPVGSGFGSSAAVAVAVVAGLRRFCGAADDVDEIERLVLETERRQHGLPSGVDHATVIRGGVVWAARADGGELEVESLGVPAGRLEEILVFDSGPPREATGTVVAAVRQRLAADPELAEELLAAMERSVGACRRCLESGEDGLRRLFRSYERNLERLQVVPLAVRELVRGVEAGGGAAKISGAGALSGTGAGSLLVVPPPGDRQLPPEVLSALRPVVAELGVEGLRLEEPR